MGPTSEFERRRSKGRMGHFHPENLEKAILAVTSRKMNQSQAAVKYGVTQSTISRRLSKIGFKMQQFPSAQHSVLQQLPADHKPQLISVKNQKSSVQQSPSVGKQLHIDLNQPQTIHPS